MFIEPDLNIAYVIENIYSPNHRQAGQPIVNEADQAIRATGGGFATEYFPMGERHPGSFSLKDT